MHSCHGPCSHIMMGDHVRVHSRAMQEELSPSCNLILRDMSFCVTDNGDNEFMT